METEKITRTYAKLVAGQLITTCAPDDDPDLIEQITADGFKPYDEDAGQPQVGPFESLIPVYVDEAGKITLYWEAAEDPEKIREEIARLEAELAATDYQVIKSYEYALTGVKSSYDISAIHTEREALRVQIRELNRLPDAQTDPKIKGPKAIVPEIPEPIEVLLPDEEIRPVLSLPYIRE